MPLVELAGRAGTLPPAHIVVAAPKLKAGVIFGFTVTVKLLGTAHCPGPGVKVYVPDAWLLTTEGFQVPLIPLFDVDDSEGGVDPAHIGAMAVNFGVNTGFDKITPVFRSVVHPFAVRAKPK